MFKKISFLQLTIGFLIGIFLVMGIGSVQTYARESEGVGIGDPWDGAKKAWELGTIVSDAGFLYVQNNENIPPHFQFSFGERVYVQYERDGFYFVEKFYDCFEQPIYGWIRVDLVLLDRNVVPK